MTGSILRALKIRVQLDHAVRRKLFCQSAPVFNEC
jgi:hypothetical protein